MRDGDTGTGTEVRIDVAECGKCTANQKMMLAYKHINININSNINILSVGTRPVGYSHSGISEHTVCCAGAAAPGGVSREGVVPMDHKPEAGPSTASTCTAAQARYNTALCGWYTQPRNEAHQHTATTLAAYQQGPASCPLIPTASTTSYC